MLTFPRRPKVEFYLGQWRDVSADIRQNPAITITHGRKDWATKTSPSLCKFTLDDGTEHGDGDYDPYNPLGQWYGTLGRNTPCRMSLAMADDTFTRTVVDGWGTSDTGDTWLTGFGAGGTVAGSDWQVASGVGTQSQPVAGGYRYSILDIVARDVEITATTTVAITNITGGSLEPCNLMVRRNAGVYYMARVNITSAEDLSITIHHSVDGQLAAPVTVSGLVDAVSSKVIRVKLQAEGPMIRAKVYAPGAEPLGWHIELHDTRITTAGQVGTRNGVASGNTNTKPILFSTDNVEVRLPRFYGETAKMVPLTSVDHKNQRTQVECASIRRRLSKGEKTLDTALYRYIMSGTAPFTTTEFWPLDYESQANRPGRNVIGATDARFVRSTGGALKWGTDTGLPQVKRAVSLVPPGAGSNGQMFADIDPTPFVVANGYAAVWLQRLGSDAEGAVILDLTNGEMALFFEPGIARLEWWPDVGVDSVIMNVGMPEVGDDTAWHVIALGGFQSGGTATFDLTIDVSTYQSNVATTIGVPDGIQWAAFPEATDGYQVTQAIVINESMYSTFNGVFNINRIRDAMLGHPLEHARERFTRLCTEEGVPPAIISDGATGSTPAMGAQRPLTLLSLTQECIDVDQGVAFDPRGAAGLGMRTHRATTARDPVLTLQYTGQVAPEFGPTADDQGTLNDVTAKRPHGGEHRIEQATGPVNTADPGTDPDAAGRYDTTVTTNSGSDLNLPDQAGWRVHLGTVDRPRIPTVTVDLAAAAVAGDETLVAAVLDANVDDHIVVTGAAARRLHDDVRLIVRGYTETVDTAYQHTIVFNSTPYEPYDVAVYNDTDARRGTAGTILAAGITSSATSFTVTVSKGELWTTAAGQFPLDIMIGGERIRISAITGASSTQTFTVAGGGRAINGVIKAHSAGAPIELFTNVYYGH
jgi:hypothetical protein